MKLITKALEKRFLQIGDQSEVENPLIIAKFFSPVGGATWYASEYDPETKIAFGYVKDLVPSENGMFDEWGSFSIAELESINLPFGLKIERDIHFNEITFNDLMQKNQRMSELHKNKSSEQSLERE
jgi:Protein of unknown function (DUF2958)